MDKIAILKNIYIEKTKIMSVLRNIYIYICIYILDIQFCDIQKINNTE